MEKRTALILSGAVVLVVVLAGLFYVGYRLWNDVSPYRITSFEECVEAGYPVMESYPRQCAVPDGKTFVEDVTQDGTGDDESICVDLCGDGTCQEVVCMGSGCPYAESSTSCPEDCGSDEAGLANPASEYCEQQGGTVRFEEAGSVGICVLPDGTECEEWAYYRGECE
ncbi:MAG: DUF333 domain-containing protein [Candidatus Dojkabacteria bacterium]|nr:DUF333 domain-containing protein [Candidatus Dojkabacteria bacterium]